ncbi:MAG: excinuclease ABC subunit UvrA [Pirellulaceae bacterium]
MAKKRIATNPDSQTDVREFPPETATSWRVRGELGSIAIRNARTHNLRGVSVDLPHGQMSVLTGVSGSGKSSLAFDTLYAEGQRQYIESLSVYARQYVQQMERPEVDSIAGLQPTLCIDQRPTAINPRSTVGTVTEIHDYLRLMMARLGTPSCFQCGEAIDRQSVEQIVGSIRQQPERTQVMVMAPLVRGRKGAHAEVFQKIQKAGLVKARVDGQMVDIDSPPTLAVRANHTIEAVVDRMVVREDWGTRLEEAVRLALRLADGLVTISTKSPSDRTEQVEHERLFSTRFACVACGESIAEIEPRTFSFNSPYGACSTCEGTGLIETKVKRTGRGRTASDPTQESDSEEKPPAIECPDCKGARLGPQALAVRIEEQSIEDLCQMPIQRLKEFLEGCRFDSLREPIFQPLRQDIQHRLRFLIEVGLHYLTLGRSAQSLSGGELQRVRLASCIGSGLVGVCYVLDEPSIGLHPRDNDLLIGSLRRLQQSGNTLVVVEHDEAMIRQADLLVDLGPGAGPSGGRLVAAGSVQEVASNEDSMTGHYLSGRRVIAVPGSRRAVDPERLLRLKQATTHNLRGIDVDFPLGCLIGVAGVSGSGKSSLILDTLIPRLRQHLGRSSRARDSHTDPLLSGWQQIERCIAIDQTPIGRTPRSCPATYCGAQDLIRRIFSATRDAKQRGYGPNRFSFNAGEGRCSVCQGQGQQRLEMNFLADLFVTCPQCKGSRYNQATLDVHYRDRNIAQVLAMAIDEAVDFFDGIDSLQQILISLQRVGLGYISLGQPSTTLSGGEAQRIKLATELASRSSGHTLAILDEPTTGLHWRDVDRLIDVLQGIVDKGSTVLVIEHHLDVLKACDWILELGPEGGAEGGQLIAQGTPEQVAGDPKSLTGCFLAPLLQRIEPKNSKST